KTMGSHTWWTEVWVTDEAAPGPEKHQIVSPPHNGIGFHISGTCGLNDAKHANVIDFFKFTDFVVTEWEDYSGQPPTSSGCFTTDVGALNHFEVRLSQNRLEVWASDADGSNFRQVSLQDNLGLNFTRGYVHFQHVHYNANKENVTP